MKCKDCEREAIGACHRCGRFYCAEHGGVFQGRAFCSECKDKQMPQTILAVIVAIIGVIVTLWLCFK